jgi:hypothetical protein
LNFNQLFAFIFKQFDKSFDLFFTTNKSSDFAYPFGSFFVCLNSEFDGSHISLRNPMKAIEHLQKGFLYLFDSGCVINLAFDHLKIPSYKMTYSEVDIS